MKRFLYIVLCVLFLVSCQEKRGRTDQGHTNACWIYAMCACIEHEAANKADDIHLSRQWLASQELREQTVSRYLETQGQISLRNVGPEVLYLIKHYGLIPDQNEKSQIDNSNVLERKLTLCANQATSMDELQQRMEGLLPQFSLAYDTSFYYFSVHYTPMQFAESVMYYQDWRFYAPSPYHPHGEMFALEVSDNRRLHEYMNLSMQEILPMVIHSLHQGHYVYWECGKRLREGIVTSSHAMAIIGINKKGDFICLNSYGTKWGRGGLCTVNRKDFMKHTCNVGIVNNK